MKPLSEMEDYISYKAGCAEDDFHTELSTDENKDYRRGYRAGVLFAYLDIKSNIRKLDDAATEQPTD